MAAPTEPFHHAPVMLNEITEVFRPVPAGTYVDATLGGGGHAEAMLALRDDMVLLGIDRDLDAIAAASKRLEPFGDRVKIEHARFDELEAVVDRAATTPISAVLFDFGVSSPQLDRPERGFSYHDDGPLDMRMNRADSFTAAEIVNEWDVSDLAELIAREGDERFARRIASAIEKARPIATTTELAEIVRDAIPAATRRTGGHPAKRTFQALRIAVNDEITQIEGALRQAITTLAPGGRGAILSYHSGEDRIAKQTLADEESGGCSCPPRLPCVCGAQARIKTLSPRMRRPSDNEIETNPRSRSARLRCFEREPNQAATS